MTLGLHKLLPSFTLTPINVSQAFFALAGTPACRRRARWNNRNPHGHVSDAPLGLDAAPQRPVALSLCLVTARAR